MKTKKFLPLLALLFMIGAASVAVLARNPASESANYQLPAQALPAIAGLSTSPNFTLFHSGGEATGGGQESTSASFDLRSGFWLGGEPTPGPVYLPLITSCFSGPEQEDNDSAATANGPLCGPGSYTGTPDDANDYFWFNTRATGLIIIDLTNHTGADVQLQVYYQVVQGTPVCSDVVPPYQIECPDSPAGKYFVRVYTPPGSNSTTPYQLTVSYP